MFLNVLFLHHCLIFYDLSLFNCSLLEREDQKHRMMKICRFTIVRVKRHHSARELISQLLLADSIVLPCPLVASSPSSWLALFDLK